MNPKEPHPLVASCVSQKTSLPVLGLPESRYLAWVQREAVPHRRLGKLVIVELSVALAHLRPTTDAAEPEPDNEVDAILQRAGLRRVG